MPSTWTEFLGAPTDSNVGVPEGGKQGFLETVTQTTATLTDHAGHLRERVQLLRQDVEKAHQDTIMVEWRLLSNRRAALSVKSLLQEISDLGFAWRDVARLMGVSVAAVQKWRKGESATGANRRKLATLLAACDLISTHYLIQELASWFETPIVEAAPITPLDLWLTGNQKLFFEHAASHQDPIDTMNSFDPDWKEKYRSRFESFRDDDGNLGLRMKER
jgi:transcriptional regulator with XRE-family HTH domain